MHRQYTEAKKRQVLFNVAHMVLFIVILVIFIFIYFTLLAAVHVLLAYKSILEFKVLFMKMKTKRKSF